MLLDWRDNHAPPQMFVTRVVGTEDLPDVEILTLPNYHSPAALPDLGELERLILRQEDFPTVGGSSIDYGGVAACRAALHQVIIDASVREGLPWNPERTEAYAEAIFSRNEVPVMDSPLSGATLLKMVTQAGAGAAFMAAFPHDAGHITLYFLLIGGTRIVLGAADGISLALKQGLAHILLKWMGVPEAVASPRKNKRTKTPGAR
jgi:hypothetical protein